MNEYRKLESAILYFADEAIGFRKSLHHYHRYIITGEDIELDQLIIEVGRENFVDFYPIFDAIRNNNDDALWNTIEILIERGPYLPSIWNGKNVKLTPGDKRIVGLLKNKNDPTEVPGLMWILNEWAVANKLVEGDQADPLAILAYAVELIVEARTNFFKIIDLVELFFGNYSLPVCMIREDLKVFGKTVASYYNDKEETFNKLTDAIYASPKLNWTDALSRNQIKSKVWLLKKLREFGLEPKKAPTITDPGQTTVVVGGWVGILPFMATHITKTKLGAVINVDIDTTVHNAAKVLNFSMSNGYTNSSQDIKQFNFARYKKLLVIDTIVEHFENHGEWVASLPKGTTVILQGNNMFDVPDHVNCHDSLEEFIGSCGLNTILWAGELNLHMCTRYMAIGKV